MEKSSALSCQRKFTIDANLNSATFKLFNMSIFFAKLSTIIRLTNQVMIPESGITRRRHSKNVHRLPFSPHTTLVSLHSLHSPIFHFALYPTWEPVHRLVPETTLPLESTLRSIYMELRVVTAAPSSTPVSLRTARQVTYRTKSRRKVLAINTVFTIKSDLSIVKLCYDQSCFLHK